MTYTKAAFTKPIPASDLPVATSSVPGIMQPDNITTTVSAGVLSAIGGSGGAGGGMVEIARISGSAASYDFTSIPGGFDHLRLVGNVRSTDTGASVFMVVQMNGDTTAAHYASQYADVNSSSAGAGATVTAIGIRAGDIVAAGASAGDQYSPMQVDFPAYANTLTFKGALYESYSQTGSSNASMFYMTGGGVWLSLAAIDRINLVPSAGSFTADSEVILYGVGGPASNSPMTTLDDLIVAGPSGVPARLGVAGSSNGDVLTRDSVSGHPAWRTPAGGGGGGDVTMIADHIVGGGGASSVAFNSIPGTFKHLRVVYRAQISGSTADLELVVNSDTGTHYATQVYDGTSAGYTGGTIAGNAFLSIGVGVASSLTHFFCVGIIDIPDYTGTDQYKTFQAESSFAVSTAAIDFHSYRETGLWFGTPAAITDLVFSPPSGTFAPNTRYTLYGWN